MAPVAGAAPTALATTAMSAALTSLVPHMALSAPTMMCVPAGRLAMVVGVATVAGPAMVRATRRGCAMAVALQWWRRWLRQ